MSDLLETIHLRDSMIRPCRCGEKPFQCRFDDGYEIQCLNEKCAEQPYTSRTGLYEARMFWDQRMKR